MLHVTTALCAETDPDLFFAMEFTTEQRYASYESSTAAKALCAACPLTLQCLMTALENKEEYGIWGGSMPRQRRQIKTKAQAEKFVIELKRNPPSTKRIRK